MSNEQPAPAPPLRLLNAFAGIPASELEKCYYTIPRPLHTYFFRRIFAGEHGIYQKLVSPYIKALYDECQLRGLKDERAIWDPRNEQLVAAIIRDLNFRPAPIRPEIPKPKRSSSLRRPAPRPDVPPGQP